MDRDRLVAFSGMKNYQVSDEDPDVRGWSVVGRNGQSYGTVRDMLVDPERMKVEYFAVEDGSLVPAASAHVDRSSRRLTVEGAGLERGGSLSSVSGAGYPEAMPAARSDEGDRRLTRAEEEVRIGKREVEAGEVVVAKHVETERIREDVQVERERVHVERRPVTDVNAAADIRADEIRVPLVEEELVIEKRPVVKEELVISKERVAETEPVDTEVRRERFDIQGTPELIDDSDDVSRRRR